MMTGGDSPKGRVPFTLVALVPGSRRSRIERSILLSTKYRNELTLTKTSSPVKETWRMSSSRKPILQAM